MSTKLFVLAALLVLPLVSQAQTTSEMKKTTAEMQAYTKTMNDQIRSMKAEHLRWASSSAKPEVMEDMHNNQMCLSSGAPCFDLQHFDENKKLIDLRLGNLNEMTDLRDHAKMNKAAADFVQERIATKVEGLKKDRAYLIKLHHASMADTLKHDITIELGKINAVIAKTDVSAHAGSAQAKALK